MPSVNTTDRTPSPKIAVTPAQRATFLAAQAAVRAHGRDVTLKGDPGADKRSGNRPTLHWLYPFSAELLGAAQALRMRLFTGPLDGDKLAKLAAAKSPDELAALLASKSFFAGELAKVEAMVKALPGIVEEAFAKLDLSPEDAAALVHKWTETKRLGPSEHFKPTKLAKRLKHAAAEKRHEAAVAAMGVHWQEHASYKDTFPLARALRRKLILVTGPTNSGKTYEGLEALKRAASGAYLAPLRLLALEVQQSIEEAGTPCTLITGEERDEREGAQHVSSTIEMADLSRPIEVAVIDEAQLFADEGRGAAWTAALVGMPAATIYITGPEEVIPALTALAAHLGEDLQIIRKERLVPLEMMPKAVPLTSLTHGDAVIAFSRRSVLDIKAELEATTDLRASVVYGALSPEVRRTEAARFRSGETSVIIATDAVGMGMNLPIARVIFFAARKYDGVAERPLLATEIKQIAGRAGRFGQYSVGMVSAVQADMLRSLRRGLNADTEGLEALFTVRPASQHIDLIARLTGEVSIAKLLLFFTRWARFDDPLFVPAELGDVLEAAEIVDRLLPSEEPNRKLLFSYAPVDFKSEAVVTAWIDLIGVYKGKAAPEMADLLSTREVPGAANTPLQLQRAEETIKILTVYAYFAYRLPTLYTEIEACMRIRALFAAYIERSLRRRMQTHPPRPRRSRR